MTLALAMRASVIIAALVGMAFGATFTLLLTAANARGLYATAGAAHVGRAAGAATGDGAAPPRPPPDQLWRERLRAARAARCARAVPGIPIACARVPPDNASPGAVPAQNLSEPLVRSVADERDMVFVAFANGKYADFATSWVSNLARANVTCLLLGAMDAPALRLFDSLDVASFLMGTPRALLANPAVKAEHGQTEYLKLGSFKTSLLFEILEYGVHVVLSDVDNLIVRDPRPFFARYPEADVLATADLLATTNTNGGLETGGAVRRASLNVGLMLLRASARPLVAAWAEHMAEHPMHWDQAVFDTLAKRGGEGEAARQQQLRRCYDRSLWCGVLPVSTFCGGHHFHAEQLPSKLGLAPYALHTTYINSMDEGKRHRLREAMLFEDPPPYYDPRPGVLTYQPDVPARLYSPRPFSLTKPSAQPQFSVAEHFALVHHQLRQLRDALALANATGRLLVLPRLVCGLDRFFYRHDGVSPGSRMGLPLWNCPADMVLALQRGIRPSPEAWLREWSFLRNPRLPAAMRGAGATHEVAIELEPAAPADPAARDAVLAAIRSPLARRARVLHLLTTPPDAQAWLRADEYTTFEAAVREWGDFWCCAPIEAELNAPMLERVRRVGELGLKAKTHIYYDMFADKLPHTDKVGRVWTAPWRPIPGERWNVTDAMSEPWRSMVVFGTPQAA